MNALDAYEDLLRRYKRLEAERDALLNVFVEAKEFVEDWRKGDFDLPTLAEFDAQSLEQALVKASAALRANAAQPKE
jgi:hypothetical protein